MLNRSTLMTLGIACVLAALAVPLVLSFASARPAPELTELYPFEQYGRWGYLDRNGQVVIEPHFDHADYFHGLGLVELHGAAGYVDTTGTFVIEPTFRLDRTIPNDTAARPFWEGLAAARTNGAWGYLNLQGEWAIPARFLGEDGANTVGDFHQGLAWFRSIKKGENGNYDAYGFIDPTGSVVIEPTYLAVNDFGEGLAAVVYRGGWGFINKNGKMKIQPKFDGAGVFAQGLAPAKKEDAGWGFIDHRGNFIIKPQFLQARQFLAGLAPVRTADGWGYLDTDGKWAIPPRFDDALWFERGIAMVTVDHHTRYIDRQGKQVWPPLENAGTRIADVPTSP